MSTKRRKPIPPMQVQALNASARSYGKLEDGDRLRFRLRDAKLEMVDAEYEGKTWKRLRITITQDDGEEVIYHVGRAAFSEIERLKDSGAEFIEIARKRERNGGFVKYKVKGYKSREGRIIGELIELGERFAKDDGEEDDDEL